MQPPHPNTRVLNEDKTSSNGYDDVISTSSDKDDASSINFEFADNPQHDEVHMMRNLLLKETLLWCLTIMLIYLMWFKMIIILLKKVIG